MSSTPRVLSEVGLVEQSPGAATVQSPSSSETAGPSNGGAPSTAAEKARAAVDEFLRVIDALPEADKLKTLRDRFLEMNVPERTDQEFLLSSAFRNVLKLAVIRCQERPSKAKVHIREVVNNMRLNSPKTPEQRERLLVNQRKRINRRSSETLLERAYLAFHVCQKKIRAAQIREESNDEDSNVEVNYVYLDRLQKRAVDLYKKIQKLEGNRYESIVESENQIVVRCTPYPEINRATAKMAKRCVKRGMTPDYPDVLVIVKRISEQDDLGMTEERKKSVATSVFREIMDQIKNRRIKETQRNLESLEIELADGTEEDPATHDEDLRRRLDQSAAEGQQKIDSVINKFADKQARGRTSSDSDDDVSKKKKPRMTNGSENGDRGEDGDDVEDDVEGAPKEENSSEESPVDEKYLETESSENEESEEVDCDEIIRRYGQERERPQTEVVESLNAAHVQSPRNGSAEMDSRDDGNDSGNPQQEQVNDVIELSSSEEEVEEPMPIRPPRRVIPQRLNLLGRPIAQEFEPTSADEEGGGNVSLTMPLQPPRLVTPKRLLIVSSSPGKKSRLSEISGDAEANDNLEPKNAEPQEVIEISD